MPVRKVIDLSMRLDERTPFYPGDPEPRMCVAQTIAADAFNVSRLELRSHSGTHRDAPFHFREDGARIDELGHAVIALFRTGWDAHRGTAAYFEHPYLDADACARLLDAGVRTIGIDAINLDETPAGDLDLERFRCHAQISDAGGAIVENLVGLGAIDFAGPFVSVLPVRIAGGDGAPARAVAIEGLG